MAAKRSRKGEPLSKQSLRVWLKLLKASSMIDSQLRRRLREHYGSTLPRFDVMSALDRHPDGLKMSEISGLLRVSNGNVTGIVDRLVEDKLVKRVQSPTDRRVLKIQLTKSGKSAFNTQAAAHETWVDELLSGLGGKHLLALNNMLDDINQHIENSTEDE